MHQRSVSTVRRRLWSKLALTGFCCVCSVLHATISEAAITVVNTATATDSSNSASALAIPVPSGSAAGDVLVAHLVARDGARITAPSAGGWTLVNTVAQTLGSGRNTIRLVQAVYYRVATGAEPGSYSWGVPGRTAGSIVALAGVDTSAGVIGESSAASGATSVIAPAVNAAQANTLLLGFFSTFDGGAAISPPTGMAAVALVSSGAGPNGATALMTQETVAAAGATGTRAASSGTDGMLGALLALSPAAVGVTLNYQINAPATAVTCEPVAVTITATNSSGVSTNIPGGTTVSVATDLANDGWTNPAGAASYQYTLGADAASVTFQLRKLTPATLEIDVSGSDGGNDDDGNQNDDFVTFSDAAFRFYGDGIVDGINTQIAAKSTVQTGEAVALRAIRTDPASGACAALVSNASVDVGFAYSCTAPASCATPNDGLVIAGAGGDTAIDADSVGYTTVAIAFDASGTGSLDFRYADAGRIQLLASATVPVAGTDPAGGAVTVDGSSNAFVVHPAGFCVTSNQSNAACAPPYHDCSVFAQAGANFSLSVSAVAWESDGESDADFCSGNAVTPNFAQADIGLTSGLVAPTDGAAGVLGTALFAIVSGGTATVSQSISEVGAFKFGVAGVTDYLSAVDADVPGAYSTAIGRFVPYQFAITAGAITAANSGYSYLSQPFTVGFSVQPQSLAGTATVNYVGDFVKLIAGDLSFGAVGTAPLTSFNGRISVATSIAWSGGLGAVAGQLTVARDAAPEAAAILQNIRVGALAVDVEGAFTIGTAALNLDTNVDGVDDAVVLGTSNLRFGRLYVQNASGPESSALAVPFRVEYWNGSSWVAASGDETQIARSAIVFTDSDGAAGSIVADPITAPVGAAPYAAVSWNYDPSGLAFVPFGNGLGAGNGDAGLSVAAPGTIDYFDIDVDLSSYPWLQFDWDQDGEYGDADDQDTPTVRVRFETFRGNDRILYWREVL